MRIVRAVVFAVAAALVMASPVLAEWPTTCVDLNDIVEAHLGNDEQRRDLPAGVWRPI